MPQIQQESRVDQVARWEAYAALICPAHAILSMKGLSQGLEPFLSMLEPFLSPS